MIYENIEKARVAQDEFQKKLEKLEEEYGVTFWENDDCAGSGYSVKYYDKNGEVKTLY
jgi:hypothetical protein